MSNWSSSCKCGNNELVKFKNTQYLCLGCGEEFIKTGDYFWGIGEITEELLSKARKRKREKDIRS